MRICSLFPGATEILFAIGAGSDVVAVSHECDWPPAARALPAVVRPKVDPRAPAAEIDRQVRERVARGESLYAIDVPLLRALQPDLVVTQELCHVCAASPDDLGTALAELPRHTQVLSISPKRLDELWQAIQRLGEATGHAQQAQRLVAELQERVARVATATAQADHRPRTLCLEWLEPPFVGGHWVPEMVACAGGEPLLATAGLPSQAMAWETVCASQPECIVVMPCGFDLQRAVADGTAFAFPEAWRDLPAVQTGRVFAVDANSYFSRSGPRLVEGIEILGLLLHPECVRWPVPAGSWSALPPSSPQAVRPAEALHRR